MHQTLLGLERMRAPPLAGAHENFARRSLALRRQAAHSPKRRGCRMETGRADCYAMPFLEDAEGDFVHLPKMPQQWQSWLGAYSLLPYM